MGKKEKEVAVKERPSNRTTKQSSKSKADTTAKKKRSVKNVAPAEPQEPAGAGGDAVENGSHNSRKDSKEEPVKEGLTAKPTEPAEWNSETVRNAKLLSDGFTCCLILVMEDSPQLSKYGEFLLRAVESGVRKKFTCISGAQTAERVKRFLVTSGQREWQAPDDSYMERQDIFAEAVKLTMLGIKDAVSTEIDADIVSKEMELAGARSKDFVRYVPPITVGIPNNESGGAGDPYGIREPPPPPPPTEVGTNQQPRKRSKTGKVEDIPDDQSTKDGAGRTIGVKTRMRKRGEVPLPEFELIDDTPTKGPRSYILLQGFYNPRIIDELRKIGVIVDGILLMTDESVTKYNFSIIDVEDSIPGTFRPRNVLPQYLKAMERLTLDPEAQGANVTKFWSTLSEMYNSAPPESSFHDIALMNFKLPEENKQYLDSPDGLTFYVSKVFDEVAKRVYEMLVLEEWFHEFTSAADVTQLQPLEPTLPRDIYEQIVDNVPAECMSVTILLEAVVQQVTHTLDQESGLAPPPPCYEEDILAGLKMGKSTFGKTDWGIIAKPGDSTSKKRKSDKTDESGERKVNSPLKSQPLFKTPMYIKSGDYASIRSCHLNESMAAKIASCQLSGDIRNIQGFLWNNVPDFNRGLYMKLLGNLNHFMYFLPPDMIQFEDMFYILHLLMSAGVEVHIQKEAESRKKKSLTEIAKPSDILISDEVYYQNRDETENKFAGTNLDMDHNYLAVSKKTGLHFVISPNSSHELTIASFGHTNTEPTPGAERTSLPYTEIDMQNFLQQTTELAQEAIKDAAAAKQKKTKKKKSKHKKVATPQKPTLDTTKVARITANNAIESAVEYAQTQEDYKDKVETEAMENGATQEIIVGESPAQSPTDTVDGKRGTLTGSEKKASVASPVDRPEVHKTKSVWEKAPLKDLENTVSGDANKNKGDGAAGFNSSQQPNGKEKRFIACEEQWFDDIHEKSVIQALLECPALLAINESGALDLSKWVEKYLFSYGMDIGGGEGILLGDLKNWNFVEELVPIQTVQMLNEATQDYLSMQRMYCPFYDTLLFIFNNPSPKDLTAETQFYLRLKTLPGLQHFLEYTMNDKDVLKWIEAMDSTKRLEMGETCNINTLLNIIPEEQWLLVPSIKYQIMVENARHSVGKYPSPPKPMEGPANNKDRKSPESTKVQRGSFPGEVEVDETTQEAGLEVPEGGQTAGSVAESAKVRRQVQNNSISNNNSKGIKFEENGEKEKENPRGSGGSFSQNKRKSDQDKTEKEGSEQGPKRPSENEEEKLAAMQAAANAIAFPEDSRPSEMNLIRGSLNFTCYDLGKRVAVVGNDTFYIFPMDGTIIRYDISTIEPEFRMMQLSVTKNGHQSFFYPYYIPHDFDLSSEDYVVCPYFHMVLSNGTILAFQDLRAEEAAPYMKVAMKEGSQTDQDLFSYEKILFGKEVEQKLNEVFGVPDKDAGETSATTGKKRTSGESTGRKSDRSNRSAGIRAPELSAERVEEDVKKKKAQKEKKAKKLPEKSPDPNPDQKKKLDKKSKKKLQSKAKAEEEPEEEKLETAEEEAVVENGAAKKDAVEGETVIGLGDTPPATAEADGLMAAPPTAAEEEPGDWMYPSSDSDDEEEAQRKRRMFFAPPWDDAVRMIKPLAHIFKVTLPSGCCCSVEDLPGPPLLRVVKQAYLGAGSARSHIEASRYYTMDGSVIKFLFNGSIQILTARGVTTNVNELAANARRDTENLSSTFGTASIVKIFNGEVILPNGQLWKVVNGKKVSSNPIYVFTTGPLSGGEIFRRRQDGVVYLHRYDGTVITHYPDGTRFTTRMVVQENPSEEFDDWVFVGLKYMIEHPNYCTVLFNTLSGNAHLKMPHGEWIRIFADGNIRITATDDYTLDVDKNRAILSYPPCQMGKQAMPNMTSVRLWHAGLSKPQAKEQENATVLSPAKLIENLNLAETSSAKLANELARKRQSSPLGGKKASRRNVPEREKNKSHAKIRLKDPSAKKLRGTRIASNMQIDKDKRKSRSPSPGQVDSSPITPIPFQDEATEAEAGGAQGESETPKELEPEIEQETDGTTTLRNGDDDDVGEFLKFENESTLCKSVDSWDNRFTMDLYGGIVVDKMKQEVTQEQTAQQLIDSLVEHSSLPKDYFAGILRNTSSEHLETAAKRFRSIKQSYLESCSGNLPNTKIFVVKRDLTGFQFMQKAVVDDIVTKAYGSQESMVIFDPLPKRQPRKFITVMRPVDEDEHPHGMWTRPYIEPMFRPKAVTNKHLRIANPNDLRWFGYVLSAAHAKRPQFMPDARNLHKLQKLTPTKSVDDVMQPSNLPSESGFEEEYEEEEYEGERSDSAHSGVTSVQKPPPSIIVEDKKQKKKKDKEAKKHAKKEKNRKRRESMAYTTEEEEHTEEEEATAPRKSEGRRHSRSHRRSFKAQPLEPEIGEYPADIEDLKGIYSSAGLGSTQNPRISLKPHETQCNTKKAVVVRAFVEIPQVNEDMQRALLAASMSYAETVKTETAMYNSYKPQDPRSDKEKKAQTEYKQQLIEQNIDEMHLLEQKPGPVLRFHF